jgi:hypothetical protein
MGMLVAIAQRLGIGFFYLQYELPLDTIGDKEGIYQALMMRQLMYIITYVINY